MSASPQNRPTRSPREVAIQIIQTLQDKGHVAYLAGGCVRDRLLGLAPKDYDVATDAEPESVRRLFINTQFVGAAFGVVLVHLRGTSVEVATFREEWGYQDGRRPTRVAFSDAQHDAQRRDFTVNGLFEDPICRRVIDYVSGRADLEARIIRAIGDPDHRFADDYLRLLRAVRFAAALDFRIERRTASAIRKHVHHLADVSRERTGQEVKAMLTGPRPALAARLIQRMGLDGPLLNEPPQAAVPSTLSRLQMGSPYATALAAWALDRHVRTTARSVTIEAFTSRIGQFVERKLPDLTAKWHRALRLSNDRRDAFQSCLGLLPTVLAWQSQPIAARKRLLAHPAWPAAWGLIRATRAKGAAKLARTIDNDARPLQAQGLTPRPFVDGDDLIQMGQKPGPQFSRLLKLVYDAQLEGTVRSAEEALKWLQRRV